MTSDVVSVRPSTRRAMAPTAILLAIVALKAIVEGEAFQ